MEHRRTVRSERLLGFTGFYWVFTGFSLDWAIVLFVGGAAPDESRNDNGWRTKDDRLPSFTEFPFGLVPVAAVISPIVPGPIDFVIQFLPEWTEEKQKKQLCRVLLVFFLLKSKRWTIRRVNDGKFSYLLLRTGWWSHSELAAVRSMINSSIDS